MRVVATSAAILSSRVPGWLSIARCDRGFAEHRKLCRGWFIGTPEGKKALLKDMATGARADCDVVKGYGEEYAQDLLQEGLSHLNKGTEDVVSDLKLAAWKVVLASWIKLQCGVGNRWFSENLCMGNICSLSKAVSDEC